MSPRSLLQQAIHSLASKPLASVGFMLSTRPLQFLRSRGELIDFVNFALVSNKSGDLCQFTSSWSVSSKRFATMYEAKWGQPSESAMIASSQDWLLQGWPRSSLGFRVPEEPDGCAREMQEFVESAKLVGIPFLDSITTFENAAEFWLERNANVELCADLLVFAGQSARAQRLVEASLIEIEQRNYSGKNVALAYFNRMHSRLFAGEA